MKYLRFRFLLTSLLVAGCCAPLAYSAELPAGAKLPAPQKTGGKPLMDALAARATSRDFTPDTPALSRQQLSNLLWAAYGVNRPDGRRTAPSANNLQEIAVYVLLAEGAFLYNAPEHRLDPVVAPGKSRVGDIRELAGSQAFAKNAPVTLLLVADFAKRGGADANPETDAAARELQGVNAGLIAQNIGLFCASEGLIGGVRMSLPREKLSAELGLAKTQRIVLAYSAGGKK
jgi:hypothetical protein